MAFRELRVNEQIRIPNVRLFDDETNEALGIVPIDQARAMAVERELDLVEVAPQAVPPVCRLMDYGRFKFEALKKEKESRREHSVIRVKEMKLRPKISEHDFQTKFGYVRHFLRDGDKVKLTIMFRGREMVHQEYGRRLLDRMAEELKEMAIVERTPLVEGRNMIMILSPVAKKPARSDHQDESRPAEAPSEPAARPQRAPSQAGLAFATSQVVTAKPPTVTAAAPVDGPPEKPTDVEVPPPVPATAEPAPPKAPAGGTTKKAATTKTTSSTSANPDNGTPAAKGVTTSDAEDSNP